MTNDGLLEHAISLHPCPATLESHISFGASVSRTGVLSRSRTPSGLSGPPSRTPSRRRSMGAEQSVETEPTPAETSANKSIGLGRFLSPPQPPSTIVVQDEADPELEPEPKQVTPEPEPKQVTPEPSFTGAAAQEEVLSEEPEAIGTILSTDDVETLTPSEVVDTLNGLLVKTDVDLDLVTACLFRIRVLCRNEEERTTCDELCAAAAVVNAMKMSPNLASLQLAGLAALVNLSGGDGDNPRRRNVNMAGGFPVIVAAMLAQPESVETQHMGCMALGNVCYGDDPPSLVRRRVAMQSGGIEAVRARLRLPCHPVATLQASPSPRVPASSPPPPQSDSPIATSQTSGAAPCSLHRCCLRWTSLRRSKAHRSWAV